MKEKKGSTAFWGLISSIFFLNVNYSLLSATNFMSPRIVASLSVLSRTRGISQKFAVLSA